MLHNILKNHLLILGPAMALAFLYFLEFTLGLKPCNLCLFDRLPLQLYIFLGLIINSAPPDKKTWYKWVIANGLVGALAAFYHSLTEIGMLRLFEACSSPLALINNYNGVEDFLNSLNNATPACEQDNFRLLGLSLANMGAFFHLFFLL